MVVIVAELELGLVEEKKRNGYSFNPLKLLRKKNRAESTSRNECYFKSNILQSKHGTTTKFSEFKCNRRISSTRKVNKQHFVRAPPNSLTLAYTRLHSSQTLVKTCFPQNSNALDTDRITRIDVKMNIVDYFAAGSGRGGVWMNKRKL